MYIPLISDFIGCIKTPSGVWEKQQQEKFDKENGQVYSNVVFDMEENEEGTYIIKGGELE